MYRKRVTLAKAVVPAASLIGGSNLVQLIAQRFNITITDETSYMIITALYSGIRAFTNWIKNRRKAIR